MSASAGMTWTNERVEQLKTLWIEGLSASQIASQLGGVTRNAVIGKIHRLGLSGRKNVKPKSAGTVRPKEEIASHGKARAKTAARTSGGTSQARVSATASAGTALAVTQLPEVEAQTDHGSAEVIPMARYLTLPELDARTCRWPIGDPQSPDFRFCGAPTEPGQVYCVNCARKAYEPRFERRSNRAVSSATKRRLQF